MLTLGTDGKQRMGRDCRLEVVLKGEELERETQDFIQSRIKDRHLWMARYIIDLNCYIYPPGLHIACTIHFPLHVLFTSCIYKPFLQAQIWNDCTGTTPRRSNKGTLRMQF